MKISIKGKQVFTRAQKVNILANNRIVTQKVSAALELVALEKAKIREERENKEKLAKVRNAMIENPSAKIKRNKVGNPYFQLRDAKGRVGAAQFI